MKKILILLIILVPMAAHARECENGWGMSAFVCNYRRSFYDDCLAKHDAPDLRWKNMCACAAWKIDDELAHDLTDRKNGDTVKLQRRMDAITEWCQSNYWNDVYSKWRLALEM